jgi:hypothetical protein
MKDLRIVSSGIDDLENGREFYKASAEGIGEYFLDSLFSDIESLRLYGGIHSKQFGFHRMLSRKFPFAIYYLVKGSEVVVYRVLDCRENPSKRKKQLKI